ncbi:sigma-70 family RNA polymerase sigma factor [Tundrisphaera lichenicola]|uniref:sigma-70 family RNA polymerase sigma factor n=1 Tax=Tundrisphaera lichenicola TaxID=2029860 RepID=UPI003EB751E4
MSVGEEEPGDLVERVRGGDERALAQIFSRYRDRLWRMVRVRLDRRLWGRVDPDDILQEAYLDATRRIGHYAAQGSMSAFLWLRLIVGQTMIDVHRRHLEAQARDAGRDVPIARRGGPEASSIFLAVQLTAHLSSPSEVLIRREMEEQLRRAIDALPPIDREVLILRHFEELTNGEVAEVLGLQPKAASIRYIRAASRLKAILGQFPGFAEMG